MNRKNEDYISGSLPIEDFLDSIIHAYDSILITDPYGTILFCNEIWCSKIGLSPLEAIGQPIDSLVKQGLLSDSSTREAVKTKKEVTKIIFHQKTGRYALSTSKPIFDESGQVKAVITSSRRDDVLNDYIKKLQQVQENEIRYKKVASYYQDVSSFDGNIVAESPKMKEILSLCAAVAQKDSTVLLTGESGTGKELVAQWIHEHSSRSENIFLPVNCGAIPQELFEAEFFGYKKGAFTGAHPNGHLGLFSLAHKGTLFLDEIGELTLPMQAKLLRVLEKGEFQPIGGTTPVKVDVRILAATNRDLEKMVKENLFREDLFYRLNIVPIHLPPLRQRKEDILPLANLFLNKLNQKYHTKKFFSPLAQKRLLSYDWPGNGREVRNVVERYLSISTEDCLHLQDLDKAISFLPHAVTLEKTDNLYVILERIELNYLLEAYKTYGTIEKASKALGMSRATFGRRWKVLKEKYPFYLSQK